MTWTDSTYLTYLAVTVPLTIWVASTLSRNDRVFLADVFEGQDALAEAVNQLLVVGFYLLNLGFVMLYLRSGGEVTSLIGLLDEVSVKIGIVMLVLGTVHVGNVWVFDTIRRPSRQEALRAATALPAGPAFPPYPTSPR